MHVAFAPYRANSRREFFKIDAAQAIAVLKLLHVEDATQSIENMVSSIPDEDVQAREQYKARRPNLNFSEMRIAHGSMLHFTESPVSVKVVGDRKVELEGEELSLTAATRQLLKKDYDVQPAPYWTFEGRSLREIYNEVYGNL